MAVFRRSRAKKGVRWQAIIRMRGHELTRTFDLNAEAKRWAAAVESAISNENILRPFIRDEWMHAKIETPLMLTGEVVQEEVDPDLSPIPTVRWTLDKALDHYDSTVVESHKGWEKERSRINQLRRWDIAKKRLDELNADDVAEFIANRKSGKGFKKHVQSATIRNDVSRISILYKHAVLAIRKGGWGLIGLTNPCSDVLLPKLPPAREMRLDTRAGGDEKALFTALEGGLDGAVMSAIVAIALDTGMRRSEILGLMAEEYRQTDEGPEIRKPRTKNGKSRIILLTERCAELVGNLVEKTSNGKIFNLSADAVATRFDIARVKAGLPNFNFHDLRHEAVSRMAEAGLTLPEIMSQSGHSSIQSLQRYMHARTSEIRRKLRVRAMLPAPAI